MSYRLHIDHGNRIVLNDLPQPVHDRIMLALTAARDDPYTTTQVHGRDDGFMRDIVIDEDDVIVSVYVGQQTKVISVLTIIYPG